MSLSPYDRDLDRNPANFQPLTPLTFLERSAAVFPDRLAIAHGALRRNYREFHARTKKLASALAKQGFARGDTKRLAKALVGVPEESASVADTLMISVFPRGTESGITVRKPNRSEFGIAGRTAKGPEASTCP